MTIKNFILDALGKFWTKLKATYVTNCASTSNNLALAASQGKALQDQITTLNSKTTNLVKTTVFAYTGSFSASDVKHLTYTDMGYSVPSGYTALGIVSFAVTNTYLVPVRVAHSSSTQMVSVRNVSSGAVSSATVSVTVLFIKTSVI